MLAASLLALAVSVEPAHLNMQSPPREARVVVEAPGAASIHLWASAGELSAPVAARPGRFEARFRAPVSGAPSYAVVAAWDPATGQVGAQVIELWARTELPVDTEPGAHVVVVAGGQRATTTGDANGRARATLWVGPQATRAHVTAEDAAGNTTVEDVPLEIPRPTTLWLVPGSPPGEQPVRAYAFSVTRELPHVTAIGGDVDVEAEPGIAVCLVRPAPGAQETTLEAEARGARVTLVLAGATALERGEEQSRPGPFRDPRWEIGGSVGPRISDAFTGAGFTVEARLRLRGSRWHLGLDLGGVYASGAVANQADVRVGGAAARLAIEARLSLGARVALSLALFAGGVIAGEQRTPLAGMASVGVDGGPSVGGTATLLVQAGPGLLTIALGGAWTPLIGLGRANLDGGMLSLGYRYARF